MKIIYSGIHIHKAYGVQRSPRWSAVEHEYLNESPYCEACDSGNRGVVHVQVHHIIPIHYCILLGRPDLELDQRNFITLCEETKFTKAPNHHLLIGHYDDFHSANLTCRIDAESNYYNWSADKIKHDSGWLRMKQFRLKPWFKMTSQDKSALLDFLNTNFPSK